MQYNNPIISGFNPDPSICRVGEDFYLVTSTFEFFPGVPIYHSKNLVNWELINYCLTSEEQVLLKNCGPSGGIYAPTIRYHDGTFFMITTNISHKWNFIVHTKDIEGAWSEPVWIDRKGIDPSLFWDDDGTCYFVANGSGTPEDGIYLCKINPFTGELLSPAKIISKGCGGKNAEGPHIYKKNGWYYLMLAEGGTEFGHMETMQRSRDIWGPYTEGPYRPILTHRNLLDNRPEAAIQATGHGDMIEDQNGNWWLVHLGIRPLKHYLLHNLGRETFLAPVVWDEEGWPIVGNHGLNSLVMDAPLPGPAPEPVCRDFADDFDGEKLDLHWNFVRNPEHERYCQKDSRMILDGGEVTLSTSRSTPTMIAVRQPEHNVEVVAYMEGGIVPGQKSGLTVFYNEFAHYEIFVTKKEDGYYVCLGKKVSDIDVVTACHKIDYQGSIGLKMEADIAYYTFSYEIDGQWTELGKGATSLLCSEVIAMAPFTGNYIGLFSEKGRAAFDSFVLKCL